MLESRTFLGQFLKKCLISLCCFCLLAENPDFDPLKIAAGEEKSSTQESSQANEGSKVALVSSVNINGPNATVVIRNLSNESAGAQFKVIFLDKNGAESRNQLISAYVEPGGSQEFSFYLTADETSVVVTPVGRVNRKRGSTPKKLVESSTETSFDSPPPPSEQIEDFSYPSGD